jgi:hypothetical protein
VTPKILKKEAAEIVGLSRTTRIAALRELYEEANILFSCPNVSADVRHDHFRQQTQGTTLISFSKH